MGFEAKNKEGYRYSVYQNNTQSGYPVKRFFLIAVLFLCMVNAYSQITVAGKPESFSLSNKGAIVIPSKTLNAIDTVQLLQKDNKTGVPNRYGVVQQVETDIKTEGVKTEIPGKGYIWQYKIYSLQAYSLGITFGKYLLPEGASVFIYDENHSQILGAFTSLNNNLINQLTIADIIGQNAVIEYFEPYNVPFPGQLVITSITLAYKNMLKAASTRIGVNCTQGDNWQDEKHAVCRMTFHDSQFSYFCTGFLVNNVKEDGTPFFQTANHCISTAAEAASVVLKLSTGISRTWE